MGVGAIVLLIVIFLKGWVATSNSAKATIHEISTNAVVDRLAPISDAQFMQNPNREERRNELKQLDSWKGADYAKKQGLVIMPCEEEPYSEVANECARLPVNLEI